jgi:spermidine synthase
LAVFLAGLSLGYRAWGRRSQRENGLMRVYGVLECVIGLWALGFPFWFALIDRWTSSWKLDTPWSLTAGGAACAILLIGLPTFCMGGTVPILTRALTRLMEQATRTHALVYAVNTAGAVAGALVTGFFLLHYLGLPGTLRLGAILNIAAGLYFIRLERHHGSEAGDASAHDPADTSRLSWRLGAIAALSGFAFMSLESIWIRFTQLSIGASSFSFSLVVAAVVLTIALGAWLVGRRTPRPPGALFKNQFAIAVSLALLFTTLDLWPWAAYAIRTQFPSTDTGFVAFNATIFVALVAALGIPAGLMGATLPLAFEASGKTLRTVGRQAGALLGWNALGSLLGGLLGGYLLLAQLNLGETYLAALWTVVLSTWIAAVPLRRARLAWTLGLTVALLALTFWFPYDPLRFAVGTFRLRDPIAQDRRGPSGFYESYYRSRTILAYRDGPGGTFAVVENLRPEQLLTRDFPVLAAELFEGQPYSGVVDETPRSIVVNGKSDSSTYYDRETLRLSAHLPALFGVRPRRALVIGLGTGVTAGELTLYPDLEQIRVVEISSTVGDFLRFFDRTAHGLREDPRYDLVKGDAFRVLRRGGERFDMIVSEPSNPWVLGVDQLFSREFYALVGKRLEQDGIFVQWIQRYATSQEVYDTVVRTLRNEFPHLRAFRGAEHDDLFVASKTPLGDERWKALESLLQSNPALRSSLAEIEVLGTEDLRLRELRIPETGSNDPLETLDRPRIHHLSGRAFFRRETLGDPAPR